MTSEIIVAVLALCGTLIGSIAGIMTANKLASYQINELQKRVEKHNQVIERVALLEADNKTQWNRIDELKKIVEKIREEVMREH